MFIGHFAVGFASKRLAPRTGLGWLMAAPLLLDLIWPIFVLTGIEIVTIEPGNTRFTPLNFLSYPYSHSLLAACLWAFLLALIYWFWHKDPTGSAVVGIGVVSHWLLDAVTHRPDLPIFPGGPMVGFGLWNHIGLTVVVEGGLFAAGVYLYASLTRAMDAIGRMGFSTMVTFLSAIYVADIFSPPPPGVMAVAGAAMLMWIFPFWSNWFDRHRVLADEQRYGE